MFYSVFEKNTVFWFNEKTLCFGLTKKHCVGVIPSLTLQIMGKPLYKRIIGKKIAPLTLYK